MTAPDLFSQHELLELAVLDTFGLLDEYESELFNRSFHHAPVPVQEEIKRLQAQIASDESLLPNEQPDRSLRRRVLEAVAHAVDAEAIRFQPLARIGRTRWAAEAARRRPRLGGSGQFWRAAAFVLAGVTVVMAYFLAESLKRSHELAMASLLNDWARVQTILGTTTRDFLLDDSLKIELRAENAEDDYQASLYVNPRRGEAALLIDRLPRSEGNDYILRVVLADGETEPLQTFASTGSLDSVKITDLTAQRLASALFWEITDLAGNVLLTSA